MKIFKQNVDVSNRRYILAPLITLKCRRKLNFTDLEFPLEVDNAEKFEKLNDWININLFRYEIHNGKLFIVVPFDSSKVEKIYHVNLLLMQKEDIGRYLWITSLSR